MKTTSQSARASNIVFFNPDDPRALESLQNALANAENIPVLGLVVKVKEDGQGEQIVNWMFADAAFVKSLALILPGNNFEQV